MALCDSRKKVVVGLTSEMTQGWLFNLFWSFQHQLCNILLFVLVLIVIFILFNSISVMKAEQEAGGYI